MNALVIKIMAVGLTLSQLFTAPPEEFQAHLDPQDTQKVAEILHRGCKFIIKNEFDDQTEGLEFLLETIVKNVERIKKLNEGKTEKETHSFTMRVIEQIDFPALQAAYRRFCRQDQEAQFDLAPVIEFYNSAFKDLEDPNKLKNLRLQGATYILDSEGQRFSEVYADNNRRRWIPIRSIPKFVQQAFVAAEDKTFYNHKGVDLAGIVRAFRNNLTSPQSRPQGGSTITQQVVKNILVGDDLTFERKMREMVLAAQVERILSKEQILELYLNYVFLGRASWGVEMAAQSYFGKSIRSVNFSEAALLAGLTKGPNYYHPDRFPDRAKERRTYVLNRLFEDFTDEEKQKHKSAIDSAKQSQVALEKFTPPRTRGAFYYLDAIQKSAKSLAGIQSLTEHSYIVRSTMHPGLQKVAEKALQDGLIQYEKNAGVHFWNGPQGSVAKDVKEYNRSWQEALASAHAKMFDLDWTLAVVLRRGSNPKVGLADGHVLPLSTSDQILRELKTYDLIFVDVKDRSATIKHTPRVQGAAVVLENKTGRVLAMAGGFSYGGSQLNRVTQTYRQPGSTFKPVVYLAALQEGYQPNTLIPDSYVRLPSLVPRGKSWAPRNYDRRYRGYLTMRQALEKSLNLPAVRMMIQLRETPSQGLDRLHEVAVEMGIYKNPQRYYPFVLGAQEARVLDMAVAYATIANDGLKPQPHFIEYIEDNGHAVYQRKRFSGLQRIRTIDRVSFYQMRRILEGSLLRGTAYQMKDLAGYVAGKTGTSNNERDAWFISFTNDLTVAVWAGYDNWKKRPRSSSRFTGARVALPIGEEIIRQSFSVYKDREPLAPPPDEIKSSIVEHPIDLRSGRFNQGDFWEVFRIGPARGPMNTWQSLAMNDHNPQVGYGSIGEEEDPYQTAWLNEDEESPDTDYDELEQRNRRFSYQPGAEDTSDLWRARGRRVDEAFLNPLWRREQ